jgi:hypothetical protein
LLYRTCQFVIFVGTHASFHCIKNTTTKIVTAVLELIGLMHKSGAPSSLCSPLVLPTAFRVKLDQTVYVQSRDANMHVHGAGILNMGLSVK